MKVTFRNLKEEEQFEKAKKALASTADDLTFYMKFGWAHSDDEQTEFIASLADNCSNIDEVEDAIDRYRNMGPFEDYGLCFDYVGKYTFKDQDEGYYRYQFSWGGPSDELRIYKNGCIEYVWMDWFVGVGFDVSLEDWAMWTVEHFEGMGLIDWDKATDEDDIIAELSEDF